MKKSLLFILIILLPFLLEGQIALSGKFCKTTNAGFDTQCYKFQNDGTFEYYESSCVGVERFIKGSYEIINSKIRLNLDRGAKKFKIDIKELPEEENDRVNIYFRVSNILGRGIQATIFPDSLNIHDFSFEKHLTDPDGHLKWVENKQNNKKLISIEQSAGPARKFELDFNKSQMVLIKFIPLIKDTANNKEYDFDMMNGSPKKVSIDGNTYIQNK
ncbi:MAG: hypothetical protein HKN51_09970 [Saprospiraceae bacterium]|nr:hypothetical protein [Saprospiraceae bacterium]